jgi:hypothetical protein
MGRPKILGGMASILVLAVVWGGWGLWTDNQILAWRLSHPGQAGEQSTSVNESGRFFQHLLVAAILLSSIGRLSRRLAKRERERVLTGRFITARLLAGFGAAAVVGAALSVWLGATIIESWRWMAHSLVSTGSSAGDTTLQVFSLVALVASLTGAAAAVWISAAMAATVWQEHGFTFYLSAEEEKLALSQASRDYARAAEKEYRDARSAGFVLILCALVALLFTFIVWGLKSGAAWPFVFGTFAAAVIAVIGTQPIGPWTSQWLRAVRVAIVMGALLYAGRCLEPRMPNVSHGVEAGTIAGILVGQAIRALRKKKDVAIPTGESSALVTKQP